MFEKALENLEKSGLEYSTPESFQRYLQTHGLSASGTAPYISINHFNGLREELRAAECMVFRLGSPKGQRETNFALARVQQDWADYFLFDDQLFSQVMPEAFAPTASFQQLLVFRLLPKLTETSLVNLAIASGLMNRALCLPKNELVAAPATGQSTFTFPIKPFPEVPDPWEHAKGQVELDALFLGTRDGKETLFVVEAKSRSPGSLAKHKLVYPVAAIAGQVPGDIDIVPVYLRTRQDSNGIRFYVTECSLPDPRTRVLAISELTPKRTSCLVLAKI